MELRLKEVCEEKGISRSEIEEKTGLKKGYLSDLFNNKCNPTLETIEKVANAIGIDLRELFPQTNKDITGFIEIKGELYRINSFEDLEKVLKLREE